MIGWARQRLRNVATRYVWQRNRDAVVARRYKRAWAANVDAKQERCICGPRRTYAITLSIRANTWAMRRLCDPRKRHRLAYVVTGIPFGFETSI